MSEETTEEPNKVLDEYDFSQAEIGRYAKQHSDGTKILLLESNSGNLVAERSRYKMNRLALRISVAILTLIVGIAAYLVVSKLRVQAKIYGRRAEAVRLTNQFHEAAFAGNTNTLNNILADDFKGISRSHSGEAITSKAELLAAVKEAGEEQVATGRSVPSMALRNLNLHEEGDTVIAEADAKFVTDKEHGAHLIYTFADRQGHLQLISSEYPNSY